MAKLFSFTIYALLWLLALVGAQETPEDPSNLPPAQVLGNGFSPASPLSARGMLDTRQITAAVVNPDRVVALPSVALGARTAVAAAVVFTQAASVVEVVPHARLARPAIWPPGVGNAESSAQTTVPPGEKPSGFSCPPRTVTNSRGDSLELGDDCALQYSPAKSTTTSEAAKTSRTRQDGCPPTRTTSTVYITEGTGGLVTVTASVTGENSAPPGFSCTPLTVTNAAKDKLALDDKCAMQLTTAVPKETYILSAAAGRVDIIVVMRYAVLGSIFTLLVGL
ncbi:hypothetical protein GX50_02810 [[Emmonsia] crescens]|uniref:Uncharacterized protein n=1 Tax=[Emmonsia] crescens TaxID=73230 RepID=A0A2B7ZNF7_9EURO|nr:hypothetical protein GX50_02810 [Emmonsia crescens]